MKKINSLSLLFITLIIINVGNNISNHIEAHEINNLGQSSLAELVDETSPSVVRIAIRGKVATQRNPFSDDPFFERFFGQPQMPREREFGGGGSGVIVDGNKHIDQINIGSLALESSGGSGQVVTSIETAMPASPTDAQLITAQGVKEFIDTLDLGVTTDSGTIAIDLFSGAATAEETLTIAGTANEIETSATGNVVTIGLPNRISVTTNLSVGGNLDVTGQTELASLNVLVTA